MSPASGPIPSRPRMPIIATMVTTPATNAAYGNHGSLPSMVRGETNHVNRN